MDTRSVAALILKVTGLILIVLSIIQLPGYFPLSDTPYRFSLEEVSLAIGLSLGPLLVAGLVLWFFPGTLTNKLVSPPSSEAPSIDLRPIEQMALTVLGVYLVTHAVVGTVRDIIFFVMVNRESADLGKVPTSVVAHFGATLCEAVIGVILCLGARGASRLIERMRG